MLTPLDELSPGFVHPALNKTIHELLLACKDTLDVKPLKGEWPYRTTLHSYASIHFKYLRFQLLFLGY